MLSPETMLEMLHFVETKDGAMIVDLREYLEESEDDFSLNEIKDYDETALVFEVLSESIEETFKEIAGFALVALYNRYAEDNSYEPVEQLDVFFENYMSDMDAQEVANSVFYGSYSPGDQWATFDGNGNIETFNDAHMELECYFHDMALWLMEDYSRLESYFYYDCDYE